MAYKYQQMPKDIHWHMIGHVQTNKVKYMAEFVSLIHAVDSLKLLKEINKQAKKHNRTIDCLLQIKIAEEDSKFGLSATEMKFIIDSEDFKTFHNIRIVGLMGMATYTENSEQIKREFSFLKSVFDSLINTKNSQLDLKILSMGMSGDYHLAIPFGSNMVRIGSSIFGERNYS